MTDPVSPQIAPEALPPGADAATYVAQQQAVAGALPEPVIASGTPSVPAKPDHVPAKFYDAATGKVDYEGLSRSYVELEKRFSTPKADEPVTPPAAPEQNGVKVERPADPAAGDPAAASPVTAALASVVSKYEAGTLEEADVASLSQATGLPTENVQLYFEGLKAIETLRGMEAHDAAGGKDVFLAAQAWAATDLSDAELEFYNAQVANPKTAKTAVEWLVQKHSAANPSEGVLINPGPAPAASSDVFRSTEEMTKAMQSNDYRTDPAFRQSVAEKIARSKQAGTLVTGGQYFSRTI